MNKVYFYQNNACVIVRKVTSDIVEVQISHKFAEQMDLRGRCEGCCIGDSDNKIPCTCENFEWVLEEIQEEENKLVVMVEKRLLSESPIEQVKILKLENKINEAEDKLKHITDLYNEWSESLDNKKLELAAVNAEIEVAKLNVVAILKTAHTEKAGIAKISEKYNSMLVYISGSGETISKHDYERLKKREETLEALEVEGVDNWEWYGESLKKLKD